MNERPFATRVEAVKWWSHASLVSSALFVRFSFFQFLFFFFRVHCAIVVTAALSMTTHSFTQSRYWNSMTLIFFATLPPCPLSISSSLPPLEGARAETDCSKMIITESSRSYRRATAAECYISSAVSVRSAMNRAA